MRRLSLICASNSDGVSSFYAEPCQRARCHAWSRKEGACTAGQESAKLFEKWFTEARDANMPSCPIQETCAWNVAAVAKGEPGCLVRRLGMLCEHQGGEWNTFQMAAPDDPVWAEGAKMKEFQFSGEIVEVGDGYFNITHDGLVMSVPCNEERQRWAGENIYKSVEVRMTVTVTE